MKKVISLFIAVMILATTVFADAASELMTAWEKTANVRSCSGNITFSTKLNRPLDILDTIPEEELDAGPIDTKLFFESFFGSTADMEYAYNVSEDMKKMDMSLIASFDVPITVNDGLKIDSWSQFGVWINYDITDVKNPVYKMVAKVPFDKKYQVMDLSASLKQYPDVLEMLATETDAQKAMQKEIMTALLSYAKITKNRNVFTVKFDDEAFKNYYTDCFNIYKEKFLEDAEKYDIDDEDIEEFFEIVSKNLEQISFLGEKGIILSITVGAGGIINTCIEELNICLNVYDILAANGLSTKGLPREKAFIDFTSKMTATSKDHNKTTVTMPELTEENSNVFVDYASPEMYYTAKEAPIFKNNRAYFPIKSIADQIGYDLKIEKANDTYMLTFADGNVLNVIENTVSSGDESYETEVPAVIEENGIYYSLEDILGYMGVYNISMRYQEKTKNFTIGYSVIVPEEEPEDEEFSEDVSEYENVYESMGYEPRTFYYYFWEDAPAYTEDGVVYMPAQEFFEELLYGVSINEPQKLIFEAAEENVFGIKTVSAKSGDNFIVVNGEQHQLEKEVKEIDGIIKIPVSYAKDLGLSGEIVMSKDLDGTYLETSYDFYMPNPNYKSEFDEEYIPETLYIGFGSDQVPYMENGELFVPAYDLFQAMYEGEWTFFDNGMKYVATEENDIKINTLSAYVGDNFVTVDDKKVEFENKVINVDDIIRVPMSFTEKLGMESTNVSVRNDRTNYSFSMDNPSYEEKTETETTQDSENWFEGLFY